MDSNLNRIGNLIRVKRKEKGLSTQQLSDSLNVSTGLINNIENANTDCFKLQLLYNLCSILDISVVDVIVDNPSTLNEYIINTKKKDSIIEEQLTKVKLKLIDLALKTNYDTSKLDLITDKLLLEIDYFLKVQ